jgi:PAS domain S-box-containing protein
MPDEIDTDANIGYPMTKTDSQTKGSTAMQASAFARLGELQAALDLSPLAAAVLRRPATAEEAYHWLHCSARLASLLHADAVIGEAPLRFASPLSQQRLHRLTGAEHGSWGYEVQLEGTCDRQLITMTGAQRIDYGGVDAIVAWFYDMAPRRDLEDRVTHEQALLHFLVNSIPDLIYYKGLDGRYLGSNTAFETFIGHHHLRGRSDAELGPDHCFASPEGDSHNELDHKVLVSGVALRQEEWWTGEDGRRHYLDVLRTPYLGPDGSTLGMIGIARDITRRKQQEDELRAAKEAAELTERYKIEFLAKVSHELRTPLNAVMGLLQLMEATPLDEQQRNYRDRANGAARVLQQIVQSILDYARIEANLTQVEKLDFSLRELTAAIIDVFGFDARQKGVELRLEYDVTAPDMVRADPVILRSALSNLVSNAIKFTERGSVTLAVVSRGRNHAGCDLQFAVIDTGVGIDMARYDELFEPFFQGVNATTRNSAGGTGLGLSICRRLVRKMEGELQCDSERGVGTTFYFSVHFGKARARHPGRSRPNPREQLAGRRILLVDDNGLNRDIVAELLQQCGLVVDQATDGREAFAAVQARDYAAVLMDIQMPNMDGYQATRLIRRLFSASRLPVIAFTAHGMQEEQRRCFEAGMNAFVRKPVERDELLRILASTIAPLRERRHDGSAPPEDVGAGSVDIAGFIAQLGGNNERAWQFLRRFRDEYIDVPQRMQRLLARGDTSTGWQVMHEFKSASGIVRADALAGSAQALETALRHGQNNTEALLNNLRLEHHRTMRAIDHADRLRRRVASR